MKNTETTDTYEFSKDTKIVSGLFTISIASIIASLVGYFVIDDKHQFFFSWLFAFVYIASIGLGALAFVVIQHITRAKWSVVVRRIPEVFAANNWVLVLLFIPVLFGLNYIFHWTDTVAVANDSVLSDKQGYLNTTFFLIRNVIYFLLWGGFGYVLYKKSVKQDNNGDWGLQTTMRRISGPAIPIVGFSVAFASFDWLMSLDPHWFSTMFGVYFFSMSFQVIFPVIILVIFYLHGKGLLTNTITNPHIDSLGKLFFGFTVFYAYIAFCQFLLIFYANIPEEVAWYEHHTEGAYLYILYALLLGRFLLPFILLLNKPSKTKVGLLKFTSIWVLVIHAIELYWIIMPTLHHETVQLHFLDFATLIGAITLTLALFFKLFAKASMIPVNDPYLAESLHQH